jgi:uncharacterized protein (TIGR02594 family)
MEQPQWLAAAWAELGQREIAGASDNPRIAAMFRDAGEVAKHHDEVPWCAAFVGACLDRAGLQGSGSLMARSYLRWGGSLGDGRFGAVAVLSRGRDPAAGHVGFLVGETDGNILLLGGNQSNAVTVAAFPKSRLLGLRWPQSVQAARLPEPILFEQALEHILEMEGGFTDEVHDPGGPTNRGITLQVFADWRGVRLDAGSRAALKGELQNIDLQTVRAIYRKRYWKPAGCAAMPAPLALFHFDAAVNHGVTGAIRLLQAAVGTDVDGEIGPLTRAAMARLAPEEILRRYANVRRDRYRALPHFWRFGRGWLNRVGATLKRAFDLAAAEPSIASQQEGPRDMPTTTKPSPKWWGESVTIWGAVITALSTVLPALGPVIGVDITGELVRDAGEHLVETVQAVGGLIGTAMTIYGRVRASAPLDRRSVTMKV